METDLDFIFKRRSIRRFQEKEVETEKIETLLKAAMAAPTAMNYQPWEFVVITEKERIEKVKSALTFANSNAPLVICVCGNLKGLKQLVKERFWVQDCSAATENILLAAKALGMGSVWCGVHPISMYVKKISEILELPSGVIPLNALFIGYPAEEKEARTQYKPEKVHFQKFGSK
jgi:nitroreductase